MKNYKERKNQMKTVIKLFSILLAVLLLTACNLVSFGTEFRAVNPSDVIITEERSVKSFTGIDFSTFGKVTITQGDSESLTITGSDNIVPLVTTTVSNGTLVIRMKENINILGINSDNVLTFNITVKDLTKIKNSGAGLFTLDKLTTDSLNITISGAGGIEIAGEADTVKIDISGAGNIKAADLKIESAEITISGLGNAEVWVTELLTGKISGAGNVRYYGTPQVDMEKTGIGNYESLGNK